MFSDKRDFRAAQLGLQLHVQTRQAGLCVESSWCQWLKRPPLVCVCVTHFNPGLDHYPPPHTTWSVRGALIPAGGQSVSRYRMPAISYVFSGQSTKRRFESERPSEALTLDSRVLQVVKTDS